MGDLLYRLLGYAHIRVVGPPERFFRRALGRGVALRRLVWRRSGLEAEVRLEDLERLRQEATEIGAELEVLRRGGLPYWQERAVARPLFLLGGILVACLYVVLSSLVWQVRVVGADGRLAQRLRTEAEALGLRPGAVRAFVPTERVMLRLRRLPGVAWVGVHFYGVDAYLEVKPAHAPPPPAPAAPTLLVAGEPGIVTRVVVLRGEAETKPGDTVVPGQLLIRGTAGPDGREEAAGLVFARVFLTASERRPLLVTRFVPTRRRAWSLDLLWQGRALVHWRSPAPPFRWARRTSRRLFVPFAPAVILWSQETAERRVVHRTSPAEARALLSAALRRQVARRLGAEAEWLERRESFRMEGKELVGSLTVEAEVDIARPAAERPVERRRP
jgi:sporulation protein YqfD